MALSDTPLSKIPVFVALSGGVDSAVAACLLKEKGHSVIGISHRHWPESRCCSTVCMDQSAMHCRQLGIPYHSIDCIVEFTQAIVEDFINHYENGITPNPCVLCNATIRFSLMMEKHLRSLEQPPDDYKLATGHYARVKKTGEPVSIAKRSG